MIGFFVHGKTFLPESKALSRVLLVCVVAQLIGGVIGILCEPYEMPFWNFWTGGAIATLPGIALGTAWEWIRDSSTILNHKGMLGFYLTVGVLLLLSAIVLPKFNAF